MATQKRITHDLRDFTRIDLRGAGDIHLTQGQDFSFAIIADEEMHEIITTEIVDETLIIGFEKSQMSIHSSSKIIYEVTMPLIAGIRIAGGGSLKCERIGGKSFELDLPGGSNVNVGTIAVMDYTLRISGGAKIFTKQVQASQVEIDAPGSVNMTIEKLDADHLDMTIKGTANIDLAGRVVSQNLSLYGVGNIKASELESKQASIRSSGLANVTVQVQDALDIVLSGAGQVRYYGNPNVKKRINGIGRIKHLGDAQVSFI